MINSNSNDIEFCKFVKSKPLYLRLRDQMAGESNSVFLQISCHVCVVKMIWLRYLQGKLYCRKKLSYKSSILSWFMGYCHVMLILGTGVSK